MVMEYLAGGEVKWNDDNHQPILSYNRSRCIILGAVLGLEYRMSLALPSPLRAD
ncbi:hypothetical protein H0H92_013643 [Tricholoma furcatifolium]|nr:hypothetical protein H0H92_013643 [Tricholoma furcatifolium]